MKTVTELKRLKKIGKTKSTEKIADRRRLKKDNEVWKDMED